MFHGHPQNCSLAGGREVSCHGRCWAAVHHLPVTRPTRSRRNRSLRTSLNPTPLPSLESAWAPVLLQQIKQCTRLFPCGSRLRSLNKITALTELCSFQGLKGLGVLEENTELIMWNHCWVTAFSVVWETHC